MIGLSRGDGHPHEIKTLCIIMLFTLYLVNRFSVSALELGRCAAKHGLAGNKRKSLYDVQGQVP
jgi:hypothetical protein